MSNKDKGNGPDRLEDDELAQAKGGSKFEVYDFPGEYAARFDGVDSAEDDAGDNESGLKTRS